MKVLIRTYDGALIVPLDGAQAFETEPGVFDILAELASRAPWSVRGVQAIAVGKDEFGDIVALDELSVGRLAGGQRRPFRLKLRALGEAPVLNIYLHVAYEDAVPDDGNMPSGLLMF